MNQQDIAKKILNTLERQKFADWYNEGHFYNFIARDSMPFPTEEEILADIIKMFDL